jgi:hypothetical protein
MDVEATRGLAKAGRLKTSSKSKFTTGHLKPRRSTRPLISKGSKGQRKEKATALEAMAKTATVSQLDFERIKRLQKLLERHEAAGRASDAAQIKEQIEEIKSQAP